MTDRTPTHRCSLESAIADYLELDGEMVSEFLLVVSSVGEDGSPGSYRVAKGPASMPLHSQIGLASVLEAVMSAATDEQFGDE